MENNLTELNDILFSTIRDLKEGKIDEKKAQSITNVGNTIINNAKTQLQAYKLTKGKAYRDSFGTLTEATGGSVDQPNKHTQMLEFALQSGYNSVADAFSKIGKADFMKKFET
jgi:poly-gamma-glutamate capsule biosynthesis protein CapA/YwtB (metallophosphatase superfamily)